MSSIREIEVKGWSRDGVENWTVGIVMDLDGLQPELPQHAIDTNRRTVYQCSYGGKNCKPTDLWLTAPFNPRIHRKGHWVRESWTGGNPIARAVIPPALCEEIVKACEASP